MKTVLLLTFITILPFIVGLAVNGETPESVPDSNSVLYPEHLDGAYTGGFGEETCRSCHFDYELNMDGGSLTVEGLDETYISGQVVPITVTVQSEQLEIAGFQMSARFDDGTQAGEFSWDGDDLMFTADTDSTVQYIQHSETGLTPETGRVKRWNFTWTAPDNGGTVVFNVSANAGNYDDSSFGDWIYAKEISVTPG